MEQKSSMTFGVISIFLVVIILCMTVFSVLSLTTADQDKKISMKTKEHVLAYYEAESNISQVLLQLDRQLAAGKTVREIGKDLDIAVLSDTKVLITEQMNDMQSVEVQLLINDGSYTIESYKMTVKNPNDTIQNNTQDVWSGE